MPAEATCKFMLATTHIDKIIVIGSQMLGPSEDDPKPMDLRDDMPFSTASLESLSRYDLLRYRLAEYMEDVRAESQDIDALISEGESAKILAFIRGFFDEQLPEEKDKPSRYFHLLAQNNALLGEYFEQVQYGMVDDLTAHAQAFMDEANEIIAKSNAE